MGGWHSVNGADAQPLERELARELSPGHVLKGVRVRAVASRFDRDDVAFRLDDGRLCVVHLTWNVERDPRWPYTEFVSELPDDDVGDSDE